MRLYAKETRRVAALRHSAWVTPNTSFIAAAAAPIAEALTAIGEFGINVPSADVLISYTNHGCIVRVAERRADHREAVEQAFQQAFLAAGSGVAVRQAGGLSLEHPSRLTRI